MKDRNQAAHRTYAHPNLCVQSNTETLKGAEAEGGRAGAPPLSGEIEVPADHHGLRSLGRKHATSASIMRDSALDAMASSLYQFRARPSLRPVIVKLLAPVFIGGMKMPTMKQPQSCRGYHFPS